MARNVDRCLMFPQIGIMNVQRAARAVEARRGELGLTQQQLATMAGVDVKTVGSLESRGRWPIARTRAAIERAMGWPPGEMARIADEEPAPPALSEATQRLMREELGDEIASRLIAHAEHLASGQTPAAGDGPARGSAARDRRSAGLGCGPARRGPSRLPSTWRR